MRRFSFILVLFYAFSWGVVSPAPAAEEDRSSLESKESNASSPERRKVATRWGRDPFVLPASSERNGHLNAADETRKPLSLSAVIYRDGKGAAIINDRIVRKGDRVEGMEIDEVFSDRVLLRDGFRSVELKLQPFLPK